MLSKNLTFISFAMSRCEILEWKSCYELEFSSVIHGNHVYKELVTICWGKANV